MNIKHIITLTSAWLLCFAAVSAQKLTDVVSVSEQLSGNSKTLVYTLQQSGDVSGLRFQVPGVRQKEIRQQLKVYVTYDPMNLGEPVDFQLSGSDKRQELTFEPKYGAYVALTYPRSKSYQPLQLQAVLKEKAFTDRKGQPTDLPYMDPSMPVDVRVESLLAHMTTADKMELLREGWGIPGIPHLYVPPITKVEAVHGFSYGSGATVFPQALAMGATFNKQLTEQVAMTIGDETVAAGSLQAWSPVLDVAQDARWGRCEETFGEDPVLVSLIGGAWIKGYQSRGLWTTPKHFGGHGAVMGGRDSNDQGISEREYREVHLVPFRHVIENYHCQSLMMAYSDFLGVPVAKSHELLNGILRQEWGFDGFIVSDCGALTNLTARKHYTAKDKVEAANQALAVGIATNCGDCYSDKAVIKAAEDGAINMEHLDETCRTLLRVMFRNELFENNPCQRLDWNTIYPGWNSDPHRLLARDAARQSIVLLENKESLLPLSKQTKTIAVIGPGADNLQPGDYSPKMQPGQLKSVLFGIREAVAPSTKVLYEQGCTFTGNDASGIAAAVKTARQADVVVMVLGDCTRSDATTGDFNTSGENHDYSSLVFAGQQQRLLREVAATGRPIVLVLQAGRPYNLTEAKDLCQAVLVNWLPGQEGGLATADVLFGDYNPAGRLPMTFPKHVGQLPLYYNFKTSGRRYNYADDDGYPLYRFGYGLSYTTFSYSGITATQQPDGNVTVTATVSNTGQADGDEVAQLYVTDMYASVKTRITQLKDFERIHLKKGESKEVSFVLTPYDLSLLNDRMDRVVEPGEFKIMVGGVSPDYQLGDRIKDSVGYGSAERGVATVLNYTDSRAADFAVAVERVEENLQKGGRTVYVRVTNNGTLTDTGKLSMYVGGRLQGLAQHYELAPAASKLIAFTLGDEAEGKPVLFTTKYKAVAL